MLNREKHQLIMGRILRDIYSNTTIAPLLGFKGGTCAYIFYDLPRFSVDLDFDLLNDKGNNRKLIFETIREILNAYGEIKDSYIKQHTIFLLLSYGDADHNIKIEINIRMHIPDIANYFEIKEYLGISMLAAQKSYLFTSKLAALTSRAKIAMRDIYDIYYFAKNNWDINAEILKIRTGKNIKAHLADCIGVIEQIRDNQVLQGLGELLSEKEKVWVKNKLRNETVFLLNNYMSALK